VIGSLAILYLNSQRVAMESVLVIRGIGVQLKTRLYSGWEKVQFIDRSLIRNVLILEGLTRYQILYYIAIHLVKQDEQLHPNPKLFVVFEASPCHPFNFNLI
jgi:hypothetical protein